VLSDKLSLRRQPLEKGCDQFLKQLLGALEGGLRVCYLVAPVSPPAVDRADAIVPKDPSTVRTPSLQRARIDGLFSPRWPEPQEDGMVARDLKRARFEA
jgi:hypothetical protein